MTTSATMWTTDEAIQNDTVDDGNYLVGNPDAHTELAIKIVFVIAAIACLLFSATSFVAINRTRRIPKTARLLSSALLFFDCATTFTYAVRQLLHGSAVLMIVQLIGIGWSYMAFINVAIMALERLVAFQWPYFYMKHFHESSSSKLLLLVVVVYLGAWSGEWSWCFLFTYGSIWDTRKCLDPVVIKYMSSTFTILGVVCFGCFTKIMMIILKQRNQVQPDTVRISRNNRPTIVVFLCCLNYVVVAIINLVMVHTTATVTIIVRRTVLDVLYLLNGLVDTLLYVLWYKECRYELLKLSAIFVPSLREKAEKMRIEIFDLLTHTSDPTHTNS